MSGDPMRAACEPRCIRVNCVPHCPICQPHCSHGETMMNNLKSIGLVIIIAILAAYVVHSWQIIANKKAFEDVRHNIKGVHGSLDQKLEKLKGAENIGNLIKKVDALQSDIEGIRKKLSGSVGGDSLVKLKEEIRLYDLDKTGLADLALESSGGCILSTRSTQTYSERTGSVSLLGIPLIKYKPDPRSIIQKNVSPGECWAFKGSQGTAVIQLVEAAIITHVSLEHIPKQLSPNGNIDSAPKKFSFWGLLAVNDKTPHLFGDYEYNSDGPSNQMFLVKKKNQTAFKLVEFTVHSNYGNRNFTCIYRVRVHGQLKKTGP